MASGSADETIKLWRTRDGERLDTLSQPLGGITGIGFTAENARLIGTGRDRRIRLWDFASREEPTINPARLVRFAHETGITGQAFSNDGATLFTASEAGEVKAWSTDSLTQLAVLSDAQGPIAAIVADPLGDGVVVGRLDGTWAAIGRPKSGSALAAAEIASHRRRRR